MLLERQVRVLVEAEAPATLIVVRLLLDFSLLLLLPHLLHGPGDVIRGRESNINRREHSQGANYRGRDDDQKAAKVKR